MREFYRERTRYCVQKHQEAGQRILPGQRLVVTVQTVPCTPLHGIGADDVMSSGHLVSARLRSVLNMRHWRIAPLAAGDFKWINAVTVHACRV